MKARGFTLIEVLVALAVIGVAMAAAIRAVSAVTEGSFELKRHLAGGWVAQNRLNEYRALGVFPELGNREGDAQQAGMQFRWRESVTPTPNRSFRRVEVKVYPAQQPDYAVTTLVGYLANTSGG